MRNKLLFYICAFIVTLWVFGACDDDDTLDESAATSGEFWDGMSGIYRGKMYAEIDGVGVDTLYQQVEIASDDRNKMTLTMSSLIVDDMTFGTVFFKNVYFEKSGDRISFQGKTVQSMGKLNSISLEVNGVVSGGQMQVTFLAHSMTIRPMTMLMQAEKLSKPLSSEAEIISMTLDHPLVLRQPTLSYTSQQGRVMVFYVPDTLDMDSTELRILPQFKLSEGATISFADSVPDFAKGMEYTVWAEDSIHRTVYQIGWAKALIQRFESNQWRKVDNEREEPANDWATNNAALEVLKGKGAYDGTDWAVNRVKGMNPGEWAAEMRTVMTGEGENQEIFAGSFFLGTFDVAMQPPLYGPIYGVPSMNGYMPLAIRGYYKYSPSEEVYEGNTLVEDTVRLNDTCCIRAIVYEVNLPEDVLDSMNYMKDKRVVAVAEMGKQAGRYQPEFTEFNINFQYIGNFLPSKKYKIAIICSSSRDTDKRRGAPGSRLVVGGLEVMFFKN